MHVYIINIEDSYKIQANNIYDMDYNSETNDSDSTLNQSDNVANIKETGRRPDPIETYYEPTKSRNKKSKAKVMD